MPIVLGLNRLRNRGCVSVWSHDRQLVYCLVTTRVAYIAAGYRLQPALAAAAATLLQAPLMLFDIRGKCKITFGVNSLHSG